MSETLRVTRQAGVTMLLRPRLALPVLAAAAVGYVLDLASDVAQKSMVRSWLQGGGAAGGHSVLMQTPGMAAFSRWQVITLEIVTRAGLAAIGAICFALALVATVRMMRRDGEVTDAIPWRSVLGLGLLLWALGAAKSVISLSLATILVDVASQGALQMLAPAGAVLLQVAMLWVLAPRAVRLAATQGGVLASGAERTGQRLSVLVAVFITLIASINSVTAQSVYAHLDASQARLVGIGWMVVGALPVVLLVIGFGLLTSREEGNQPDEVEA